VARRRWVWPLACGAIVLLVLALWIWPAPAPETPCNACGAPGIALALAPPSESARSGLHLYNFSIEAASTGLIWNHIAPEVQTTGARIVPTDAPGWSVTAFGMTGDPIGFYTIQSTGVWTVGGAAQVSSGESILLQSPSDSPLSGDNLVLAFSAEFQGTIAVSIP
jgi:hypothetical protein